MDPDTFACLAGSWVDMDSSKSHKNIRQNIETTLPVVNETIFRRTTATRKRKNYKQRSRNMKKKTTSNCSLDKSLDYTDIPDQIFY
jgi:hypothetical protein